MNGKNQHLCILPPNWIGDAIMAQPAMRALSLSHSGHVSIVGQSWLAALLPYLNLDNVVFAETIPADADQAVLFPNSFRAAWNLWRAGVPERIGFSGQWRSLLLTQAIKPCINMADEHHRHYFLDLVEQMSTPVQGSEVQLAVPEKEARAGQETIRAHGLDPARTVCVAPGAQFGGAKRYPSDSYAKVLTCLCREGWQLLLLGTQEERNIADACLTGVHGKYWNAAGETSLSQALQILAAGRLLLCNDSGLMHVAAGMGKPVVAVFGATDPVRTAPSGAKVRLLYHPAGCSPCLKRDCTVPDHPCMANTKPEEVLAACLEVLR